MDINSLLKRKKDNYLVMVYTSFTNTEFYLYVKITEENKPILKVLLGEWIKNIPFNKELNTLKKIDIDGIAPYCILKYGFLDNNIWIDSVFSQKDVDFMCRKTKLYYIYDKNPFWEDFFNNLQGVPEKYNEALEKIVTPFYTKKWF